MSLLSPIREAIATTAVRASELVSDHMYAMTHAADDMGRPGRGALPVVIQGGLSTDAWMYAPLKRQLQNAGFDVFVNSVNWHGWDTVESDAQHLQQTIERAKAATGADRVSIVAHSKGGVIAREYIQHMGGLDSTAQLITIGTPHQPVTAARTAAMLPEAEPVARAAAALLDKSPVKIRGAHDLMTDSPLMTGLNEGLPQLLDYAAEARPDFSITSISGRWAGREGDGIVPNASSELTPLVGVRPNVRDLMFTPESGPTDHLRIVHGNRAVTHTLVGLLAGARQAADGATLLR